MDLERASGPRDRMLTGDAVNTAARLQTGADPAGRRGTGRVRATKEVIDYRELAPLDAEGEGRGGPGVGRAARQGPSAGRAPRSGWRPRSIGRDEELAVLKQTFHRVESEGRPALVTVVGPAGVGKSRLAGSSSDHVEGLPEIVYWRRGRCLAYGNTSVLGARGRDEGAVRDPRGRPGGRRARRSTPRSTSCSGTRRSRPQIRALVGGRRPGVRPRGAVRRVAAVPRADRRPLSAGACPRGHPLGRRRPARLPRPPRRLGAGTDPRCSRWRVRSCSSPAHVGRRQAQRGLDLPGPAHRGRERRDARRSPRRARSPTSSALCRRAQRGQPAVHRGDRARADRRGGAARDRSVRGRWRRPPSRSSSRVRSKG